MNSAYLRETGLSEKRYILLVILVLVLSVLDLFLTLEHLQRGLSEANPVMLYFLKRGILYFVTAKLSITIGGMALLLHVKAYKTILVTFYVYVVLTLYHSWLILEVW
jgi:hypothetical protein